MAENDVLIEIVGRKKNLETLPNSLDYQPFGVKVLKLRVKRNPETRPSLGPIWIHPINYQRPDGASDNSSEWQVYGTADNDEDLWIGWGAGDEKGFCAKMEDPWGFSKQPADLDDDKDYYIFLHLIHRPDDPAKHTLFDKTVTIVATSEDKDGNQLLDDNQRPKIFGRLEVTLTIPEGATNPVRPHWQWNENQNKSIITLSGIGDQPAQIPQYVSRWWPLREVNYQPVNEEEEKFLKKLQLHYTRQVDGSDQSKLELFHDNHLLAAIDGDIRLPIHDYRLFTIEMFRFVDDHQVVLRFWFYWLNLNFTEEQLMQFVPQENQAAWQEEAERVRKSIQGGLINKSWREREEVPDIERFDLILPLDKMFIKHVGTDIHWQEYWSRVTQGRPLRCRIATATDIPELLKQGKTVTELTPMRRSKLKKLLNHVKSVADNKENGDEGPERPPTFDPLANGLCDYANEQTGFKCPNRPTDGEIVPSNIIEEGEVFVMCERCGTHVVGEGAKAVGALWGKHAPKLDDETMVIVGAVSTNVLHG